MSQAADRVVCSAATNARRVSPSTEEPRVTRWSNQFRENWRESDAPTTTKLAMALRNNAIKVLTARTCCGHHGEPGC
jgi:hypothetical protein